MLKNLIPSVVTGIVVAVIVLLFDNPPSATTLVAGAGSTLLWMVAIAAVGVILAPAVKRYGKAYATMWWEESRGTILAIRDRFVSLSPQARGVSGWKVTVAALILGLAMGLVVRGGFTLPTFKIPSVITDLITPGPATPDTPTAAVYIFEKDDTGMPSSAISAGLSKLNAQGIVASAFEEDTTDSTGETPEQYKLALAEAKKVGLPALVVLVGDKVTEVVQKPTTEQHVLDIVK